MDGPRALVHSLIHQPFLCSLSFLGRSLGLTSGGGSTPLPRSPVDADVGTSLTNNCLSLARLQELSRRLGTLVQGQFDQYNRGVIYTPAFVARHKARIRGLFSAVTR